MARLEAALKPRGDKEIAALAQKTNKDLGDLKQRANGGDQRGVDDMLAKLTDDINKLKAKAQEEVCFDCNHLNPDSVYRPARQMTRRSGTRC